MSNRAKMIVLIILTAILGLLLAVCARLESRTFPAAPTEPEAAVSTGPAESFGTTATTEKPIETTETSVPAETTAPETEPAVTEAPETEPKETQKPASKPAGTKPKPTDPPATEPPATEPPATSPSPTEPDSDLGDIEDGLGWG